MTQQRALIGDSPKWIAWHVIAVWVVIPVAVLAYVGLTLGLGATTSIQLGSPKIGVTVYLLAVQLNLARMWWTRRRLPQTDRGYLRFALFAIGMFGFNTVGHVSLFLGAVMFAVAWLDRAVVPNTTPPPVTKEYREWLEAHRGDAGTPEDLGRQPR